MLGKVMDNCLHLQKCHEMDRDGDGVDLWYRNVTPCFWLESDQTPLRNWSDLVLTGSDQICSEKLVLLFSIWLEEWSQKF